MSESVRTETVRTETVRTEAADAIARWRVSIDLLDERIIALLRERIGFSQRIQRRRIGDGGGRVAADRERDVVGRYSAALGDHGEQLAGLLLEMSRGTAR
jgi:monofunctional chorismate mutase